MDITRISTAHSSEEYLPVSILTAADGYVDDTLEVGHHAWYEEDQTSVADIRLPGHGWTKKFARHLKGVMKRFGLTSLKSPGKARRVATVYSDDSCMKRVVGSSSPRFMLVTSVSCTW